MKIKEKDSSLDKDKEVKKKSKKSSKKEETLFLDKTQSEVNTETDVFFSGSHPSDLYFKDIATNNFEAIQNICSNVIVDLNDNFGLCFDALETGKDDNKKEVNEEKAIKLICCIVGKTFESTLEILEGLSKTHSAAEIDILDELKIGFVNNVTNENEVDGNIDINITHLYNKKNLNVESDEDDVMGELTPLEKSVRWLHKHCKKNPAIIDDISSRALKKLAKLKIILSGKEVIMPVFIFMYKEAVEYVKLKRGDKMMYSIDFLNCFDIAATEYEDGDTSIILTPSVYSKLHLKNDSIASDPLDK